MEKVPYIGHTLTSKGLKPDEEKVKAILQMPEPATKEDLQRFMGLIQYLSKFVPKLSEKAAPLRALMKKNAACNLGPRVFLRTARGEGKSLVSAGHVSPRFWVIN